MFDELSRNQLAIGGGVVLLVVVVIAVLALGGGGASDASARDAVLADVESIRQHEIDHKNIFGDYIAADAAPRAPHEVTVEPVAWTPSRGFKRLSWEPASPEGVQGSYSVVVEAGGFRVIGVADGDGDGKVARIEATADQEAHLVTGEEIY